MRERGSQQPARRARDERPEYLDADDADAYRARIREQFITLCAGREALTAQLDALDKDTSQHGNDRTLLDELPQLAGRLDDLPERIQAELFAAFDIQILWNPPMKQATFFATITGTTPGIVAALLDRAGDDNPAASTGTDPEQAPASTGTFSVPARSGILPKTLPVTARTGLSGGRSRERLGGVAPAAGFGGRGACGGGPGGAGSGDELGVASEGFP